MLYIRVHEIWLFFDGSARADGFTHYYNNSSIHSNENIYLHESNEINAYLLELQQLIKIDYLSFVKTRFITNKLGFLS